MTKGVCKRGHALEGHNVRSWVRKVHDADGEVTGFAEARGCRRCWNAGQQRRRASRKAARR